MPTTTTTTTDMTTNWPSSRGASEDLNPLTTQHERPNTMFQIQRRTKDGWSNVGKPSNNEDRAAAGCRKLNGSKEYYPDLPFRVLALV